MKAQNSKQGRAGQGRTFDVQGFQFATGGDFAEFNLADGAAMAAMFKAQQKVMMSLGVEDIFTAWYALAHVCANEGFEGLLRDLSEPLRDFFAYAVTDAEPGMKATMEKIATYFDSQNKP